MKILFKGGQWTNTEDEALKVAVTKYGKNNWGRVASLITRKSADQCKQRYEEWIDPTINHGEWTHDEELKLLELVDGGHGWRLIASQMPGRTAVQCMEHHTLLVDRARGEASGATKAAGPAPLIGARLHMSEQDTAWESKPAKADAVDKDDYEQDLINSVIGRIGNTKGKRELRKQRERELAEAKRRTEIQLQREMREAGLGGRAAGSGDANGDADDDAPFVPVRVDDLDPTRAKRNKEQAAKAAGASPPPAALVDTVRDGVHKKLDAEARAFVAFDSAAAPAAASQLVVAASRQQRALDARADQQRRLPQPPAEAARTAAPTATVAAPTLAQVGLALPELNRPPQSAVKLSTAAKPFCAIVGAPVVPVNVVRSHATALFFDVAGIGAAVSDEMLPLVAACLRAGKVSSAAQSVASNPTWATEVKPFSNGVPLSSDDKRCAAMALIDAECRSMSSTSAEAFADAERRVQDALRNAATPSALWSRGALVQHLKELEALGGRIAALKSASPANQVVALPYTVLDARYTPAASKGVLGTMDQTAVQAANCRGRLDRAASALEQLRVEASTYQHAHGAEREEIVRRGLAAALE